MKIQNITFEKVIRLESCFSINGIKRIRRIFGIKILNTNLVIIKSSKNNIGISYYHKLFGSISDYVDEMYSIRSHSVYIKDWGNYIVYISSICLKQIENYE